MTQNIQELVDSIRGDFVRGGCRSLLTAMAQELGAVPELRRMALDFEDRTKYPERPMLTLRDENPSIYLLGWREDEFTEIHDHDYNEVGIYVLQGIITEDVYGFLKRPDGDFDCTLAFSRELELGQIISCPVPYVHRMGNLYPEMSITLHCYGPTLSAMKCYEETEQRGVFRHKATWQNHRPQH